MGAGLQMEGDLSEGRKQLQDTAQNHLFQSADLSSFNSSGRNKLLIWLLWVTNGVYETGIRELWNS